MDYDTFDHEAFFANPEPEPNFSLSDDNPPVTIPPDLIRHDELESGVSILAQPWQFTQPSEDIWYKIWDDIQDYIGSIVICNLDTGCNKHDIIPEPLDMKSFINGQSPFDGNGHGTHTCSTSVAIGKKYGVAPGANLIVGKVLSNGGSGSSDGIEAGCRWAKNWSSGDLSVDVINLSLGGGGRHAGTVNALVECFEKGIISSCAAGNSGTRGEGYPAKDPEMTSIGNYRSDGLIANSSSRGSILVACPGTNIYGASHRSPNSVVAMTGTSMAAPFFAGLNGILLAYRRASGLPRWRDNQPVFDFWKKYAIDTGRPGYDDAFGHGKPAISKMIEDLSRFGKDIFIQD